MKPYFYINNATIGELTGEKIDAMHEAERQALELAESNPGESFEILRCVGVASTSKASTFWMDGEGPPQKPRWRYIESGEQVLPGDQWQDALGEWHDASGAGYIICQNDPPHRRPL